MGLVRQRIPNPTDAAGKLLSLTDVRQTACCAAVTEERPLDLFHRLGS